MSILMSTLLIRLVGPMQSWGTQSRHLIRDTGLEPSKSGVIGLICAALGKPREESPNDGFPLLKQLATLDMGVRVDLEGSMRVDYQTAGGFYRDPDAYGVALAEGKKLRPVESWRYYLADAAFLVGLGGDRDLLSRIYTALQRPRWQLYLGRKAFIPSLPIWLPEHPSLGPWPVSEPLETALSLYPWLGWQMLGRTKPPESLRLIVDATPEESVEVRFDHPVSFDSRQFLPRHIRSTQVARPRSVAAIERTETPSQDASLPTDPEPM